MTVGIPDGHEERRRHRQQAWLRERYLESIADDVRALVQADPTTSVGVREIVRQQTRYLDSLQQHYRHGLDGMHGKSARDKHREGKDMSLVAAQSIISSLPSKTSKPRADEDKPSTGQVKIANNASELMRMRDFEMGFKLAAGFAFGKDILAGKQQQTAKPRLLNWSQLRDAGGKAKLAAKVAICQLGLPQAA